MLIWNSLGEPLIAFLLDKIIKIGEVPFPILASFLIHFPTNAVKIPNKAKWFIVEFC